MTTPTYLLGIDVGTGGAKAILVAPDGTVAARTTTEYPLSTPRPQWSEQDPHDWWRATIASIGTVLARAGAAPAQVAAVGLTGQMHGLVLLDAAGEVLRPAILWNDQRTAVECAAIHDRVGRDRVVRLTGKPVVPSFTAPKVLWLREHEPHVPAAAAHLLLPKDYVRHRLAGRFHTDVADASGTSLLDIRSRTWSDEMLDALDIDRAWLPEVSESPVATSTVSTAGAAATGLLEGTPIVAGAGDQAAEAVGCGIVDEGVVSVTTGTSGVVFAALRNGDADLGGLHGYCHAVPGMWHAMGVMLSAGGSFRWYRDTLGRDEIARAAAAGDDTDPYDLLTADAARVAPGAEGLVFLPYLAGERTPYADPNARGAFVGLTLRHDKAHMTRAVMEGVAFGLRDALELVRALGRDVARVRISGGGARSPLWRQMMADVFEAEVATVNVAEGAAFGAAILAGVGAGVYDDVAAAARTVVRETSVTRPGPDAARYRPYYERYRALYPALASQFEALTRLAQGDSGE